MPFGHQCESLESTDALNNISVSDFFCARTLTVDAETDVPVRRKGGCRGHSCFVEPVLGSGSRGGPPMPATIPPPLHPPGTSSRRQAPPRPLRPSGSPTLSATTRRYPDCKEPRPALLPTRRKQYAGRTRHQSSADY